MMIIQPGRSLRFPAGRRPKLNSSHPLITPGAMRSIFVARADGSIQDLFQGSIIPGVTSTDMNGVITPFGPGVVTNVQAAGGLYKIPVINASESVTDIVLVALVTILTHNSGQGVVNIDYSTGTSGKINIAAAGAGFQTVAATTVLFNPTIIGHTYFLVMGFWTGGSNTNRYWGFGIDLTSGQTEYYHETGATISLTASATAYGGYTYSTGTTERNYLHAGAIFLNGGGFPTYQDIFNSLGTPWDLWYKPDAYRVIPASLAPAPSVVAPVNLTAPVVSGTIEVGQILSTTNGTWTNNPTSYAYQWENNGSPIAGATASAYQLQLSDLGALISCVVTATNAGGSTGAASNQVGPIQPAPVAVPVLGFSSMPLPWRFTTPLHKVRGSRSLRQTWKGGSGVPLAASPLVLQFPYEGGRMDRIVGIGIEIAEGGTPCDLVIQERNTGWFYDVTYGGTALAIGANVETLVDQVNLVLYFSVSPGVTASVSFFNFEVTPFRT